ncbi:MAG TPA: nitroreductase family deazaflavin-dependent oxidoreductase [Thermoleophilaceae bacterium]|jgi:deazaflavin-dependent oxidoreductase (nitroreductase family)
MNYLDVADRVWPVTRRLMGLHTLAYRATRGVIGHTAPGLPTMLLLEHVGAKSGQRRTAPLLYFRDGDDLVIVASKGGFPKHPAWFHNLKANPDTEVQVGSERRRVRARIAEPDERKRLWPKAVASYGGYRDYQARTDREIPLVILERR